ncbi:spore coat protein CotJB [Alkalihalobacillus sp. BA299]|uniref:spore coat protein CotJB n=1 Tax=Alkalihalobacillus sp. BA299 TaxID=2815938 RepID=UPI001ADD42FC|nr:spore coat protein CotJB [Alkalihalobacillus sp. BA299]
MKHKQLPPQFYELMKELQAVDFVLIDLTLYLDTHPNDTDAIQQFNQMAQVSQQLKIEVEKFYGPLLQYGNSYSGYPWNWNESPWPWEL